MGSIIPLRHSSEEESGMKLQCPRGMQPFLNSFRRCGIASWIFDLWEEIMVSFYVSFLTPLRHKLMILVAFGCIDNIVQYYFCLFVLNTLFIISYTSESWYNNKNRVRYFLWVQELTTQGDQIPFWMLTWVLQWIILLGLISNILPNMKTHYEQIWQNMGMSKLRQIRYGVRI